MKKAPIKRTLPTRQVITEKISTGASKTVAFVDRKPMTSFFAVLGFVVLLIVLSNFLNKPKAVIPEEMKVVKSVSTYHIGSAPKITVSAQTKKSGVIQIVALSGGVIDKINVQEGSPVNQGDQLLAMSNNYKGENSASVSRQIAVTQYHGALATYPKQKESIEKQKELAERTDEDSDEMRQIVSQSLSETRSLLQQNEDFLKLLQDQLATTMPANAANPAYVALRGQVIGLQATVNQTKQQLRSDEYSSSDSNPPAEIDELTKDIAKKNLDVQLKQLQVSLAVSGLQAQLSQIQESVMFPSAPFNGTVQRVLVKEKQSVGQGTALLVLSQAVEDDPITAVAFISADVARRVSRIEPSTLHIGDKSFSTIPTFVSTEAVQGSLYAVYFAIPDTYHGKIVSEGFISVDIPIGMADTTMIATYVPLDAVYQTREKAYVFVVHGNTAKSRDVQLGQVYGDTVEILSGLKNGDQVILNRNIIAGDMIQTQ